MKGQLLIVSDGNGVDTDFKKWPFFVKLLTNKQLDVINKSIIGAGNEIMLMQIIETVNSQKIDYAIIQWSIPQRLDVIANDFWRSESQKDETYSFNIHNCLGEDWWVTSASKNQLVREYHSIYVNQLQAKFRSYSIIMAAAEFLRQNNIEFVFSLCYANEFVDSFKPTLDSYKWAWHQPYNGLSEFRQHSKYAHLDTGLAQPHTLIQLDWIEQVLKPACHFIDFDHKTYYNIEQSLLKHV